MAETLQLVSPYEVRSQFHPLHARHTRWFIGVAHRRAGKTVADINELVIGATKCRLANPRFAYVAPQLNQAKDIAWTYLKEYTAFLSPKINESELWVELPGGARIRIYGADNPDRLRGIYLDGVVLDEFGDLDPGHPPGPLGSQRLGLLHRNTEGQEHIPPALGRSGG